MYGYHITRDYHCLNASHQNIYITVTSLAGDADVVASFVPVYYPTGATQG